MRNLLHRSNLIIVLCSFIATLNGQNLIENGSFEKWSTTLPEKVDIVQDSPDFYKRKSRIYPLPLWDDSITTYFPNRGKDGVSYLGLHSNVRSVESIGLSFVTKLTQGETYLLSCAARPLPLPSYAYTNKLEYAIVDSLPILEKSHDSGFGTYNAKDFDKLIHQSGMMTIYSSENNWDLFQDEYTARGGEKYLLIFPPIPYELDSIYYYMFDDFKLTNQVPLEHVILFETNTYQLTESQTTKLQNWLKQISNIDIDSLSIHGYADYIGNTKSNLELSKNRAQSVYKCIQNKYPNILATSHAHGETEAITAKDKALNRKVAIDAHMNNQSASTETIDPKIIERLQNAYDLDQNLRSTIPTPIENIRKMEVSDSLNKILLEQIFTTYGYLGVTKGSSDMKDQMAILTLHQDLEFQKKYLSLIEEAADYNECSPSLFAYLIDKIKVAQKEPQFFGSQLYYSEEENLFKTYPIARPEKVDERRKEYGLGPLKKYLDSFNENK